MAGDPRRRQSRVSPAQHQEDSKSAKMRIMRTRCPRLTLLALVGACQTPASDSSGFSSTPAITSAPVESTDTTAADNSSVVFVSCVLEYVTDIDAALREISRIAGSADNVFVRHRPAVDPDRSPLPWCAVAWDGQLGHGDAGRADGARRPRGEARRDGRPGCGPRGGVLAAEEVEVMATTNVEQALELARAEARMLSDQLRQARADIHRLGISDQNRALVCAAVSGAIGIVCGVGIGITLRKR